LTLPSPIRVTLAAVAFGALAACSGAALQKSADRAQTEMVGLSREDLLRCAGRPSRRSTDGDTEFWTYVRQSGGDSYSQIEQGGPQQFPRTPSNYALSCEATFRFEQGKVAGVSYRGASGGAIINRQQVCGQIVEYCLRR